MGVKICLEPSCLIRSFRIFIILYDFNLSFYINLELRNKAIYRKSGAGKEGSPPLTEGCPPFLPLIPLYNRIS